MFWNYLLTGAIGFLLGLIVEFGYLRVRGHRVVMPFITSSSRNFTVAAVLLALISLTTVYNVEKTSSASAECNRQFREALAYNIDISTEQRRITELARELQVERRHILDEAFIKVGENLGDQRLVREAIDRYNNDATHLSKRYADLTSYQESLNKDRREYPEPSCGLS